MITIHEIGSNGYWTGRSLEIGEMDPAPSGWTRSPMPVLNDGEYAAWHGEWVATTNPPPSGTNRFSSVDMASQRLVYINESCNKELVFIRSGYPDLETTTWIQQEKEARAYIADNTAPIPLVMSIATRRGVPVDLLCAKIIEKADAFSVIAGNIIGKRQHLEDILDVIVANPTMTEEEKIAQIGGVLW